MPGEGAARPATTRRARWPRIWTASSPASPCRRARGRLVPAAQAGSQAPARWSRVAAAALWLVALALGLGRAHPPRGRAARAPGPPLHRAGGAHRGPGPLLRACRRLHDTRADRQALRAQHGASWRRRSTRPASWRWGPGTTRWGAAAWRSGTRRRRASTWRPPGSTATTSRASAYALALVLGHLYQEQLLEAERPAASAEQREARRSELERRYRDPAPGWLRQSEGAEVPSTEYVAALLAFYEDRSTRRWRGWTRWARGCPGSTRPPSCAETSCRPGPAAPGTGRPAGALADLEAGRQA